MNGKIAHKMYGNLVDIELRGQKTVRLTLWLAYGLMAVLLLVAAVIGLRVTPPDHTAQPLAEKSLAQPAPSAPAPAVKATAPLPSFDIVTVEPRGQAVMAGRAAPGDRVKVLDGGKLIAEVTAEKRPAATVARSGARRMPWRCRSLPRLPDRARHRRWRCYCPRTRAGRPRSCSAPRRRPAPGRWLSTPLNTQLATGWCCRDGPIPAPA